LGSGISLRRSSSTISSSDSIPILLMSITHSLRYLRCRSGSSVLGLRTDTGTQNYGLSATLFLPSVPTRYLKTNFLGPTNFLINWNESVTTGTSIVGQRPVLTAYGKWNEGWPKYR
jgi:hypothetical protein